MSWLAGILAQAEAALPLAPAAQAYLAQRGVTPAQQRQFHLGYADPTTSVEAATDAWVTWARWNWSGRLVFPFYDALGTPIGMQTRSLVEKDYQIFHAYPAEVYPYAFGLPQALPAIWETGHVVLVEGVFDALAAVQASPCTIAALRTKPAAALLAFLRRYARHVTVLFDMDGPGRTGAFSVLHVQEGFTVRVPAYPAHDPAELVQSGQLPFLQQLLKHTRDVRYL